MNTAALLTNAALSFGDRPALSLGHELRLDYRTLWKRVTRLAGALRAMPGMSPGERVGLVMSNRTQYVELLFAVWHAGLCAVPVNAKLHPREVAFILRDCATRCCFVTEDLAEALSGPLAELPDLERQICVDRPEYEALLRSEAIAQHACGANDLAWIFYTSGTTGKPKGAMLTHLNLQVMAFSYLCDVDFLTEQDCLFHLGAQSHAAGLFSLPHIAKATHQVVPASGAFDADELIALIARYRNATFFVAPTMLRRLMDHPRVGSTKVENIRTILCGAAPVYVEDVKRALNCFGARFWNGYGQGESPCTISAVPKHLFVDDGDRRYSERIASVGIARTGVEVRVIDAEDRVLPHREIGEIVVRGDTVMRGYWNNPDASQRALRGGWLHTGDLGLLDADGFLTLKDRSKDLIISGGANIYPREVEEVLLTHPGVSEVAVVGAQDAEWGERVAAFVVRRNDAFVDDAALDALCLANIARFKRPKEYHFVRELPKNSYGKVLKTELRTQLKTPA